MGLDVVGLVHIIWAPWPGGASVFLDGGTLGAAGRLAMEHLSLLSDYTPPSNPLTDVRFEFVDLDGELVACWRERFADVPAVTARQGSILEVQTDAIVSPANSFGFMDGGLDLALSMHFGWQMEANVRRVLLEEYDGELPVGLAIVVPTEHGQVPWLVSAPTMRVPMVVKDTANAHLAFRAILRAVRAHNLSHPDSPIGSVACPGLGTGNGMMPPDRCARQMREAYEVCVHGRLLRKGGLAAAARQHMAMIDYDPDARGGRS